MAIFIDSSALAKRYLSEVGSEWVERRLQTDEAVVLARTTAVEVTAAVARRMAGPDELAWVLAQVREDCRETLIVDLDQAVADHAMALAARHRLRGYDSIQLASAVAARRMLAARGVTEFTFVSADRELNAAACAEWFVVEDPLEQHD